MPVKHRFVTSVYLPNDPDDFAGILVTCQACGIRFPLNDIEMVVHAEICSEVWGMRSDHAEELGWEVP